MSGVPDYAAEETLDFKFTSRAFATGIPTTLAGSPVIEIYEDNSDVQITAGITLTVDFDSVTGLNNLRVVATTANGFEAGKSYSASLSAGTVDSVSVVGEVVQQFSIERAPVNWANVTAPTTALALTQTTINPAQVVASVTAGVTLALVQPAGWPTTLQEFNTAVLTGTVDSATFAPTVTTFETDQTDNDPAEWTDQALWWLTGANAGTTVFVTAYDFQNSKVKLTVSTMQTAPSDGDTFQRMGRSNV